MSAVTLSLRTGQSQVSLEKEKPPEGLSPDLEDIRQIDENSADMFEPVLTAPTLSDQISALKLVAKNLKEDQYQICAIVLVQWYLSSTKGSAVKKALASCFNTVKSDKFQTLVTEQVACHITSVCAEEILSTEVILKLSKCFDNFKLGEKAVFSEHETVTAYLIEYLEDRLESVCESDVAPVDKARLTEEASECTRTLVAVVKGAVSDLPKQTLDKLSSMTKNILAIKDLPLDLKSNCGIIAVVSLKAQDMPGLVKLVSNLAEGKEEGGDEAFYQKNAGAVLSILHGAMCTLSVAELSSVEEDNVMMENILKIYLRVASEEKESSIVLGHSRGILSWSIKLLESSLSDEQIYSCVGKMTEYLWGHLEHSVDSVKHNAKNTLANVILKCKKAGGKCLEFLDKFLVDTMGLPKHKKGRFVSLSCLVKSYSVEKVIESYPNIHEDILEMSKEYALVAQISDLYEGLMGAHHELCKDNLDNWLQVSVKPLLTFFNQRDEEEANGKMLEGLLKKAVKLDKKVIEFVLTRISEKEGDSKQLRLALCCLKMARELGETWDFAKNERTLLLAFSHPLDEVRMQALSLCAESHSTIEVFSEMELTQVLKFVRYNLALQSAASRQNLTIAIKKILTRVGERAAALGKKLTQKKFEPNKEEFTKILKYYGNFLTKLSFLMYENLFAGANFPRRDTSLTILFLMHKIIGFNHSISHINLSKTLNTPTAHTLLTCLHDSYELNKERAFGLLRDVPPNFLSLDHPNVARELLDQTVTLMTSSKPPDSVTAKYLMKLLLTAPAAAWVFADVLGMARAEPSKVKLMAAVHIRNLLAEQLAVAEGSLVEAAGSSAMYGTLVVLRGIYEEVGKEEYGEQWTKLSQDLIGMSYNIWRVVSPVVASDSPEGHLPMDLGGDGKRQLKRIMRKSIGGSEEDSSKAKRDNSSDLYCAVFNRVLVSDAFPDEIVEDILGDIFDSSYMKAAGLPEKVKSDEGDDGFVEMDEDTEAGLNQSIVEEEDLSESGLSKAKEVSSQMLLLCAWRSVKEVALFLGDLCHTFSNSGVNIVTSTQILDISSFLMDLLSETKHRGAFEQAYVAFTKLCATLWKSNNLELHSHPQELLDELLVNLRAGKKSGKDSLCATRRSAGVPFIVQAIVSTDPDPSGAVFRRAMSTLLELAADQSADAEARVHSFNVLRALYKDTRLGEIVSVFVEEGVKVAVIGFKATNWAERNAATLLFSSLMTRIFGVKREKDTLSSKNCLTGKVFFQRYPSLHPFLLEQLEESSSKSEESGVLELHPALYPILLILARIYPSPSEQVNNALKLSSFLPLVSKCAGSPILQTRQLAAKALVPILPSEESADFVRELFKQLEIEEVSQNLKHGILLQLKEFVVRVPEVVLGVVRENVIKEALVEVLVKKNKCYLTAAEFIGVVNMVIITHETDNTEQDALTECLAEKVFDPKEMNVGDKFSADIWKPLFMKSATEYLSKASLPKDEHGFIIKLLVHPEYEVRLSVLEILTQHLSTQTSPIPAKDLTSLLYVEKHDSCLQKLLSCCSFLPQKDLQDTDHVPFLISLITTTNNDDVSVSGLKLSSKLLCSVTDPEVKLSWSKLIRESCGPEQTTQMREAAVNCLLENVDLLKNLPSSKNPVERNACMILWSSLLIIMFDDDSIIRGDVEKIASILSNSQKEVEYSLAVEILMTSMMKIVGRSWPGGALILVLGHLLTTVFDEDSLDGGVSAESDKAFDKNEMNIFQELITMAGLMLPPLSKLVTKLSPGMQKSTFDTELSSELVEILLPELPGAVRVYSNGQLLEYLGARSCRDVTEAELVMMGMIFSSLRCNKVAENCSTFLQSWDETCKKKGKTFLMDRFRRMVEKTGCQSG